MIQYAHEFLNANVSPTVYMANPNLPLRYEIENDGTGAASTMAAICGMVSAEGGEDNDGITRLASTGGTHVDANAADTLYAVVGIRLKSTHLNAVVKPLVVALLTETNDDFEWALVLNPTVAGTFTYSSIASSAVERALGATANTVTGGTQLGGGWISSGAAESALLPSNVHLGASIAGVRDQIVLCARPLSSNADIQGSLTFREFS